MSQLIELKARVPEPAVVELMRYIIHLGGQISTQEPNQPASGLKKPRDLAEIKRLYQEEDLSQADIALMYGVSPSTIKEDLRGVKRPRPAKEAKPKRPVGRPRLSSGQKVIREKSRKLRSFLQRAAETIPPRAGRSREELRELREELSGKWQHYLDACVAEDFLPGVEWMGEQRPWVPVEGKIFCPPELPSTKPAVLIDGNSPQPKNRPHPSYLCLI